MTSLIPKEAIEKAVEGGWEAFGHCSPTCPEPATFEVSVDGLYIVFHEDNSIVDYAIDQVVYPVERIAFSASFWQCLGKALGWATFVKWDRRLEGIPPVETWRAMASRFVDLVLTGKDTTEFWQELLGKEMKQV
jgi:hypothetical protein